MTTPPTPPPPAPAPAPALESFYYALNQRDETALRNHPLAQLNNPLGGIRRGGDSIAELYRKIFAGHVLVQVTFSDVTEYLDDQRRVRGRETGTFTADGADPLALGSARPATSATRMGAGSNTTTTAASTTQTPYAPTNKPSQAQPTGPPVPQAESPSGRVGQPGRPMIDPPAGRAPSASGRVGLLTETPVHAPGRRFPSRGRLIACCRF